MQRKRSNPGKIGNFTYEYLHINIYWHNCKLYRVLELQVDLPVYFKNQVMSTTLRGISRKSIHNSSFKLYTNDKSKDIKEGSLSTHAQLE